MKWNCKEAIHDSFPLTGSFQHWLFTVRHLFGNFRFEKMRSVFLLSHWELKSWSSAGYLIHYCATVINYSISTIKHCSTQQHTHNTRTRITQHTAISNLEISKYQNLKSQSQSKISAHHTHHIDTSISHTWLIISSSHWILATAFLLDHGPGLSIENGTR